ncbi:MAG: type II toxin-antitoxin system VapC family toxin [Kineosporiaceae bacterium]|nr:type II toxin-antitoxin system VapC family toxin [Kineosporiaceae bacterium]MBK7621428.1 type II toxin-antitoxin system VapC family toxin [Kineosporiaceae bacterium]MBK8077414.1 type II toxin-antitoxin system VapC family toxin [Kineosporiaceae bacterium]
MKHLFLDTATLLYATGTDHPLRRPCRDLLAGAAAGELELHVSVEAVQEYLFHRMRRGDRPRAVAEALQIMEVCRVHAFDVAVARRAIDLVATSPLRGRDAVHAATALTVGFETIVSPDTDFDHAPGLLRTPPQDALGP